MCRDTRNRVKREAEAKDPDDPRNNLLTNKLCGWCSVNAKAAGAEENCDACEHAKAIGWVRKETGGGRGYRFEPPAGVNATKIDTVPKFIAQTTKVYGDHFRAQQQQQAGGGGGGGGVGGGSEETREDAEQSDGGGGQETGGGGGRGGEQTREETRGGTDGEDPNAGGEAATGGGTPFEVTVDGAVVSAEELLRNGDVEGYYKAVREGVANAMRQAVLATVKTREELESEIARMRTECLEQLEGGMQKTEDGVDAHLTDLIITQMLDVWKREMAVLKAAQTQLERYERAKEAFNEEEKRELTAVYDEKIQKKETIIEDTKAELKRMAAGAEEEFRKRKAELKKASRLEVDTPERSKRKLEVFLAGQIEEQTKLDFGR